MSDLSPDAGAKVLRAVKAAKTVERLEREGTASAALFAAITELRQALAALDGGKS